MFTDGLDQSAINWIKKGSPHADEELRFRSPLTENLHRDPFPRSALKYSATTGLASSYGLPPLKFHSGLLTPHSMVVPPLRDELEEGEEEEEEEESVASAPENGGEDFSEYEEAEEEALSRCHDEEDVLDHKPSSTIKRGLVKERSLKIEIPDSNRKLNDYSLKYSTPGSCFPGERIPLHSNDQDMGTPSAPPLMGLGGEGSFGIAKEVQHNEDSRCSQNEPNCFGGSTECLEEDSKSKSYIDGECDESMNHVKSGEDVQIPYWQTTSDHLVRYNASGQYAWQGLVTYDACVRLCLYAWSRGSAEAPEFLRDECLVLRSAFGLHKYLLQPRGVQPTEVNTTENPELKCPMKAKKVVGKIKVEVKKLRLVPRRKLRSTSSMRGAMYLQMGADYARHVSSLVKNGISSLKQVSFSLTSEEQLSCVVQLKSATDDARTEVGSAISLRPASGNCHTFFPESEGDSLIIEVKDGEKTLQGRATIPISFLAAKPSEHVGWWPINRDDQECVGKIQLYIVSTLSSDENHHVKSGSVVETLAYDLLLEAAMRAQQFHPRNLRLQGPWKWLLTEFAGYYGVSDSYTKLRYLLHVMNVATPTKNCLEIVYELLAPIVKARRERSLTRQEKSILLDCETQIEKLLANVFENYKSLDENSPSGIADTSSPMLDFASPALYPAVQVFTLLHDILTQEAQSLLRNYLQNAARKRCRKHMAETDEYVLSSAECFFLDSITVSTAYLKMKNLCTSISKEIQADIKINNEHVFPSSIDLSRIPAAVYSTELCNRVKAFLAACPPSSPQTHVNEFLIVVSDFEANLNSWDISPEQDGIDSKGLFQNYIMVWVQDMELKLLERCKAEKVPWSGVMTNHSTSPFAEDLYEGIKDFLSEYEVVISRWPEYTLNLESAVANVERAIVKSLEKQYSDILTPLKDSIPKRLNMQVQKLARRQSAALYTVPNQLGTFLNTIKRILDVLHCRIEDILKSWASCLPVVARDNKAIFGEQMNAITIMLRTKYKNYMQASIEKLLNNIQANRSTRLKSILDDIKEEDGEAEVRESMHMLCSQLTDSISNLHEVFASRIFVATCRGFWDRMGQVVLKFLEARKENQIRYKGSYYALVVQEKKMIKSGDDEQTEILDDTFASQMQRLLGNSLQEKDLEPPRSVIEARSILCRDTTNSVDASSYFYI